MSIESDQNRFNIDLNEQLVQACIDFNLPTIERLLNNGANPNFLTFRNQFEDTNYLKTPLDIVSSSIQPDLDITSAAKLLLDHGAWVEGGTSGKDFITPLHWATGFNNLSLTQLLITHGANINARDYSNETPLHHSCKFVYPSSKIVELLIVRGAHINAQSNTGETPASLLMLNEPKFNNDKLTPIFELFSTKGADFSIANQEQKSAFSLMQNQPDLKLAVLNGVLNSNTNNQLINKIIPLLPKFGLTTFDELKNPENKNIGLKILDEIIEVHLASIYPKHLLEHKLIQATIDCDIDKMESLLKQGADPNFISPPKGYFSENYSALHFLTIDLNHDHREKIIPAMELLLAHGANPNQPNSSGNTPLITLAKHSVYDADFQLKKFQVLLNQGADSNIKNNNGYKPSFYLWEKSNFSSLVTLMEKDGIAFDEAVYKLASSSSVIFRQELKENVDTNIQLNEQLMQACLDLNLGNIKRLLNEGAYPNFLTLRDNFENGRYLKAPLDIITSDFENDPNAKSAIKLLLDHGAIVQGGTSGEHLIAPLHWATWPNDFSMAKLLIDYGANINVLDYQGDTPLHFASSHIRFGNLENLNKLIELGPHINARNNFGETPVKHMLEEARFHLDTVELRSALKLFAKNGADFSIVDNEQKSAWSLIQNNPNLKLAVLEGALEGDVSNNELTKKIIELAQKFGLTSLEELLNPANESTGIAILDEIIEAHLIFIYPEHLLEHKLIQATIDCDIDKIKSFLKQGADPNFISPRKYYSDENFSALHFLVSDLHSDHREKIITSMEILLEYSANPNLLSTQGDTPFHILAKNSSNYNADFQLKKFDVLLKHGADTHIQNNEGQTPVFYLLNKPSYSTLVNLINNDGLNKQADNQFDLPLTEKPIESLKIFNDTLSTKPNNETRIILEEVIPNDSKNILFLEPKTDTPGMSVIDNANSSFSYESYMPHFMMQWLGLEKSSDHSGEAG